MEAQVLFLQVREKHSIHRFTRALGRKRVGEAAPFSSPAGRTTSGGQLGRKRVGEAAPFSSPAGRTPSGGQLGRKRVGEAAPVSSPAGRTPSGGQLKSISFIGNLAGQEPILSARTGAVQA